MIRVNHTQLNSYYDKEANTIYVITRRMTIRIIETEVVFL